MNSEIVSIEKRFYMNPWEQKLKDSGLSDASENLTLRLDSYKEAELSIEDRDYLDKIRAVNEVLRAIIDNADPRIINYSALSSIVVYLNNINSYLNDWGGGTSPTYLSSYAMQQADMLLQQISLVVPAMNIPEARAAITSLRRSAARQKTIVDGIISQIKEKGSLADTTIDNKIADAKEIIDNNTAVVEKKLEDITKETEELAEQLETVKSAANKLATEQTTEFNTTQTARSKEFTDLMSLKRDELTTTLNKLAEEANEKSDAINTAAEKSAKATEDAKKRAEKLLGIISEDALVNKYSKNALHERKVSTRWQRIAVAAIIGAIVWAGILAHEAAGDMVWQKLVARLSVAAASGGLATYAAKQAAEHRQAQRQSENMSLQLSAVRPYLEDITDKTKRDELLIKLAEKFFGEKKPNRQQKKAPKDKGEEFISANDLLSFIATLIKKP